MNWKWIGLWCGFFAGIMLVALVGVYAHPWRAMPRIGPSDLLMLIPITVCGALSMFAGNVVTCRGRFVFGALQGLAILFTYGDYYLTIAFAVPVLHLAVSAFVLISIYAAAFGVVTNSFRIGGDTVAPMTCSTCGYCLYGLDRPRCPECGTPFRQADLAERKTGKTGRESFVDDKDR